MDTRKSSATKHRPDNIHVPGYSQLHRGSQRGSDITSSLGEARLVAPRREIRTSWGRILHLPHDIVHPFWRDEVPTWLRYSKRLTLPYGMGASYGDCCLNGGEELIETRSLDRILEFDIENGILRCETGISLAELLTLVVPKGWFLPVCPGTKFITIGGAIANDIHGKNHHKAGTFGNHIIRFELIRSDGTAYLCSASQNADLFKATIGGLGLTGFITWVEFKLKPIQSSWMEMESIKFSSLEEFFEISESSDIPFEYTVAWVDSLSKGSCRGVFLRANHSTQSHHSLETPSKNGYRIFIDCPSLLLNHMVLRSFNSLYYHKHLSQHVVRLVPYDPFFFPLDSILDWNRLYGKKGFFQYQMVLPSGQESTLNKALQVISRSGLGSFLTTLKRFSATPSPGLLSFPLPGWTLALDFPNRGEKTLSLFQELDSLVLASSGRIYLAKDIRASPNMFKSFPQWERFQNYRDPRFSSTLWRRITSKGAL